MHKVAKNAVPKKVPQHEFCVPNRTDGQMANAGCVLADRRRLGALHDKRVLNLIKPLIG